MEPKKLYQKSGETVSKTVEKVEVKKDLNSINAVKSKVTIEKSKKVKVEKKKTKSSKNDFDYYSEET